jgi:hypothetical protein
MRVLPQNGSILISLPTTIVIGYLSYAYLERTLMTRLYKPTQRQPPSPRNKRPVPTKNKVEKPVPPSATRKVIASRPRLPRISPQPHHKNTTPNRQNPNKHPNPPRQTFLCEETSKNFNLKRHKITPTPKPQLPTTRPPKVLRPSPHKIPPSHLNS